MALGFIKKVFTFGKDKPAADKPTESEAFASLVDDAEKVDAGETIEALPEAADLIAAEVIDTAGGPAADEAATELVGDIAASPIEPEAEEREEAEEFHPQPEQPADVTHGELAQDADNAVTLPKGFAAAASRPEPEPETPAVKLSWFQRLRQGLARTSSQLTGQIAALFTKRKLDEDTLEELEDLLIQADLGVETAMRVTGTLSSERYGKDVTGEDVSRIMAAEITKVLKPVAKPLALDLSHKPHVILVVGVNGTGKTTTIGKLTNLYKNEGRSVLLAAADTFRAAAIEQLQIWGERTDTDVIRQKAGADPSAVLYDAVQAAKSRKSDYLIVDTAGRLHTKENLMAELEKMRRTAARLVPDAPHDVLLVMDATTGQNGLEQARRFAETAGVTGIVLTKLDGTAKGGVVVPIARELNLPIRYVGVGEKIDDLLPFEAEKFVSSLFEA